MRGLAVLVAVTAVACGTNDEEPKGSAAGGGAGGSADASRGGSGGRPADAADDAPLPPCPTYADGVERGAVESAEITEASGMAASRKNDGVLWVHNDSGDTARVFAMGLDGSHLGVFDLPVLAFDWEDMAVGPGPDPEESYLYLGDIGDNLEGRGAVLVYRVAEPTVAGPGSGGELPGVETFRLAYPDRPHDAEALLVDPAGGDLFIVTKERTDVSGVYRALPPLDSTVTSSMERVATLPFGMDPLPGGPLATGGEVSASGDLVIVKTYSSAYVWRRRRGAPLAAAFLTEPCRVPVRSEPQGEAIAFAPDGSGYYTVSEGTAQPLFFYAAE